MEEKFGKKYVVGILKIHLLYENARNGELHNNSG
jgi:hypothetical protein